MRHDGCAENPDREQDALRARKPGNEDAMRDPWGARLGHENLQGEGGHDDADQAGDDSLEAPEPFGLQRENSERGDAREERGGEEGDAEDEVEPDRRPHELREIGRHRDDLGLDPEQKADLARETLAADLGQVLAGGDAELRAHRLHEHRHQVGHQDDPEQQVAVPRPGRHVGREVPGIDVRDRGDEGGAEEGRQASHTPPPAGKRLLGRLENPRLARQDVVQRMDEGSSVGARGRLAIAARAFGQRRFRHR